MFPLEHCLRALTPTPKQGMLVNPMLPLRSRPQKRLNLTKLFAIFLHKMDVF